MKHRGINCLRVWTAILTHCSEMPSFCLPYLDNDLSSTYQLTLPSHDGWYPQGVQESRSNQASILWWPIKIPYTRYLVTQDSIFINAPCGEMRLCLDLHISINLEWSDHITYSVKRPLKILQYNWLIDPWKLQHTISLKLINFDKISSISGLILIYQCLQLEWDYSIPGRELVR